MPTNNLPGSVLGLVLTLAIVSLPMIASADEELPAAENDEAPNPEFVVQSVHGKVVWYELALEQRLGVKSVVDQELMHLALQSQDGELIPLIEDLRGHAFRTDPRLRQMEVELLVRRYRITSGLQVLKVHEIRDREKLRIDYWCDICSIAMFETGPCSCCQEDNRLRKRAANGREFGD